MTPSFSEDVDIEKNVKLEQLRIFYTHATVGSIVSLCFSVVLAGFALTAIAPAKVFIWIAIQTAILVPRIFMNYSCRYLGGLHSKSCYSWTLFLLALHGVWWGVGGAFVAQQDIGFVALVIASIAGTASVATFQMQASRFAATVYVTPMTALPALSLLLRFDLLGMFSSVALLLFLGMLLMIAARSEAHLTDALRLRFLTDRIAAERASALELAQRALQQEQGERALREERMRMAALHEAITARSEFLSKISHELRSPLQGIVSALDVFEMRHGRGVAEDDELIRRMRRSSMLLNTQLRDLLTLARGQAGRLELRPEPFEACALLEAIVEAARESATAKGLNLQLDVPNEAIFVVADGARIDQVLTNLVVNATRYIHSGDIRVSLTQYDTVHHTLHFTVSDNGPGIPAARLATLFSPNSILSGTESKGEGSGLGLAIVSTLVTHMGGKIEVDSKEGQGTTFTLEIPAEHVDPESKNQMTSHTQDRVLVIDDRHDVLDAIGSVIDQLGYQCDRADSVAVAANFLAAYKYDTVLFDINMPVKTGTELAAEIRRSNGPNARARFIGMSAADGLPTQVANSPFDTCLAKPIDRSALQQALLVSEAA